MEIIREDFKKANDILREFDGKQSRLWSYDINFNVIEILVFSNKSDNCVFLTLPDCLYFKGNLNITNASLRLSENENEIFKIDDANSDFEIIFKSGFILKKGLYGDFFSPNPYEIDIDSLISGTDKKKRNPSSAKSD